jgi:hypothetical protein
LQELSRLVQSKRGQEQNKREQNKKERNKREQGMKEQVQNNLVQGMQQELNTMVQDMLQVQDN